MTEEKHPTRELAAKLLAEAERSDLGTGLVVALIALLQESGADEGIAGVCLAAAMETHGKALSLEAGQESYAEGYTVRVVCSGLPDARPVAYCSTGDALVPVEAGERMPPDVDPMSMN